MSDFYEMKKAVSAILPQPTLKDRLYNIPYLIGYYIAVPFVWFFGRLWDGVSDAWTDER